MISVIVPAFNEEGAIGRSIDDLRSTLDAAGISEYEIIVVNDGSSDSTGAIARERGAHVIENLHNLGYGHSLKRGILAASFDTIAITDADGTYPVQEIPAMLEEYRRGFDMVIGSRSNLSEHDTPFKRLLRRVFRRMVEIIAGRKVPDVNSGLRIFSRKSVLRYFPMLCNTFSFTTSQTLALMLDGHFVSFYPLTYQVREGSSKVRLLRDSSPVSGFPSTFLNMHTDFFGRHAPVILAMAAALLCCLLILSYRSQLAPDERRLDWMTGSIALLALVPFYGHMVLLHQHTAIHQWAIGKIVFAYALIPFALLPAVLIRTMRVRMFRRMSAPVARRRSVYFTRGTITLALAIAAAVALHDSRFNIGLLAKRNYEMWNAIRTNTGYRDVVFSSVLEARPIKMTVGISNKLVYRISNWTEVDRRVAAIWEPFNVVIAVPSDGAPPIQAMGKPDEIVEAPHLRLLRFRNYPGARSGCA